MAPAPRLVKIPDAGSWNSYNGKSALREAIALSRGTIKRPAFIRCVEIN
jgi:hypothetical protein